MPDPKELAEENLKRICRITGASYSPDHRSFSPMGSPSYPGPWVRIVLEGVEYYISVNYVHRYGKGTLFDIHDSMDIHDSTCYYLYPAVPSLEALPYAENVASALLLLRNDPGIFYRWARRDGPYA